MNAPSGVVTFLFTDIEGSTRRWEADPEGMRAALAAHDEVLRQNITGHGGSLFKHTGDGVCAAFGSPRAAVDAAVAAQRSLDLPVRMGIATGEAELRDGDYFGTVLNRAARVMSAGHGGQVLLDGLTADLVSDIDLKALGAHRLRDIAKLVQLSQVRAPGLRDLFPPLKTAEPAPGNMRAPGSDLLGREPEVTELTDALAVHRLVTLTGVGGVGKTRLALEVAARTVSDYPDGVWFIELAAVGDPDAVPEAVAAVLGITAQPGLSMTDSVAAALDGRTRLLVIDNCEHVLDAAADLIEAILAASSTVRVLATSREGLRLHDERLRPVPSLDVRAGAESAAVELFLERAAGVAPGASLADPDDLDTIVELCRRLDGIPLAIELAASRLVSMTITELRDRLDDRFRLLVGSRRGLERHQTLRHAVQWSYDLLGEDERTLLTQCSVFAGGFELSGACALAQSGDELATLDLLDSLVRKSLVVADRSSGRTRFSMLETIRQFAEEQLVANGAAHQARAAHARYFGGREDDVLALWNGPRQRESYDWFTVELANLRAAFRWAADEADLDTASGIACYAAFLGTWVEQYEPVAWTEEVIERAKAVDHRRVAQLHAMAAQCVTSGRIDDALVHSYAGQAAVESGRYDEVPFGAEGLLGGALIVAGQPERWAQLCRRSISRRAAKPPFLWAALVLALTLTDGTAAMSAAEGLLAFADVTDNPHSAAIALLAHGFSRRNAEPDVAYQDLRRSLATAQRSGNRWIESHVAGNLATLAVTHGDSSEALELFALGIRNFYDSGNFALMRSPVAALALLFDRLGFHESAATMIAFGTDPLALTAYPDVGAVTPHLREVLGGEVYEALAAAGQKMTNAAMAAYVLEQIDRVHSELRRGVELR